MILRSYRLLHLVFHLYHRFLHIALPLRLFILLPPSFSSCFSSSNHIISSFPVSSSIQFHIFSHSFSPISYFSSPSSAISYFFLSILPHSPVSAHGPVSLSRTRRAPAPRSSWPPPLLALPLRRRHCTPCCATAGEVDRRSC